MKLIFVSLSSMVLLASATPILSDPASAVPVKGDLTLDRRSMPALDRDTAAGNTLEKRNPNRTMTIPNHVGTVVKNIGLLVVKAIVDAAGELIFQITNNSQNPYQVSFREYDMELDAATLNVAAHHTINYDPLGGIKPGDLISINAQRKG
ncbi:hypothetical protein FOVG_19882 [Fusarium oxysporum f. sp. pisi HDV247]|uniref:Uncharacterized protein n=1 Tax=Fusarium oxysporum f. sp. pisi HDV247 TaxID=1080344 RepID=W9N7A5_FUSOX|nr:hypothetical protein FOVG_19882 [Fusarium oxysporum f. sp. pisi HDV247]